MNQFRDLTMCALIILAISLLIGQPETWGWTAICGGYVVSGVNFLADSRPWSIIILMALALALFMTRLKY
jgi:hypothetical protein